jgi:hypothetical protein
MDATGRKCNCFDCEAVNEYSLWKLSLLQLDPNMSSDADDQLTAYDPRGYLSLLCSDFNGI